MEDTMGNKVEKVEIVSAMPLTKAVILFTDLSPSLVKPLHYRSAKGSPSGGWCTTRKHAQS